MTICRALRVFESSEPRKWNHFPVGSFLFHDIATVFQSYNRGQLTRHRPPKQLLSEGAEQL